MDMKYHWVKSVCLCIGSILILGCCRDAGPASGELRLSDGWKVQSSARIVQSGEVLSTAQADVKEWYEAVVPSTVMGTLVRNGLYTDVLEGLNYEKIDRTPFDTAWWYRTEFEMPRLRQGQHAALELDGISYRANIWMNGKLLAACDSVYGTFRRHRLDITEVLGEKNVLAVEVFRARPGEPNIGFVDWNPRPADESMGIFREVRVSTSGEVVMNHPAVKSKVNTETLDEAWLTVETELANLSGAEVKGELRGAIEGQRFCIPVTLAANERRVIRVTPDDAGMLHLKYPRLWWCHNLGTPEMYRLDLEFATGRGVSDNKRIDFGVREISDYFTEEGYRGFVLNGKKVLVRSAGWTDDIFLRDTPETNEMQVKYVRDMNLNSIRFENIWGTSQNLYDLCDRYGLLVLAGWSCHWEWENYLGSECDGFGGIRTEADMDMIARSLNDQVLWLRNHPSIIGWFVGSDMMPRPELEKRYMACLSQIDDRPYLAAAKEMHSELTGPTGMKMAGPYEYVAPNYWFDSQAPGGAFGFNTETGIGAQLPVKESLRKMIPADKLWPIGKEWSYHCTTSATDMNTLHILQEAVAARYGQPADLDDFLRKADWMNYEGTRAMFEAFRVGIPRATGIVQWMLNSAWPSLYWQLYDHYGIPTAAYYSVKNSNRTRQLIYDYGKNAVFAVNEGAETCAMDAEMYLYGLDGQEQGRQRVALDVAPYTVKKVFDVPALLQPNAFLFLRLNGAGEEIPANNYYCLSSHTDVYDWSKTSWVHTPIKQYADFTALASLPQALCGVQATVTREADEWLAEVTLENTSSEIAFFVRLSLKDETGELLAPVFWSDNYLALMPGEKRVVKCAIPGNLLTEPSVAETALTVSGWNVAEKNAVLSLASTK